MSDTLDSQLILLNTTKLARENPQLYQFLKSLLASIKNEVNDLSDRIINSGASFLTANYEADSLINSKQLLAGIGVKYDDSQANKRVINVDEWPVNSIFSSAVEVNPGDLSMLGFGTWQLFAVGILELDGTMTVRVE